MGEQGRALHHGGRPSGLHFLQDLGKLWIILHGAHLGFQPAAVGGVVHCLHHGGHAWVLLHPSAIAELQLQNLVRY
jgi:hypothetical protein